MKKVSEPYGWEPIVSTIGEQCLCCKGEISAGVVCVQSRQPGSTNVLCLPCRDEYRAVYLKTGWLVPLYRLSRYRPRGRIEVFRKHQRAARKRELAKGHAVKV